MCSLTLFLIWMSVFWDLPVSVGFHVGIKTRRGMAQNGLFFTQFSPSFKCIFHFIFMTNVRKNFMIKDSCPKLWKHWYKISTKLSHFFGKISLRIFGNINFFTLSLLSHFFTWKTSDFIFTKCRNFFYRRLRLVTLWFSTQLVWRAEVNARALLRRRSAAHKPLSLSLMLA